MYNPNVALSGKELEKANFDDALTAEANQREEYFKRCQVTGETWKSIPTQIEELKERIAVANRYSGEAMNEAKKFDENIFSRIYGAVFPNGCYGYSTSRIETQKCQIKSLQETVKRLRLSLIISQVALLLLAVAQICYHVIK